MLTRGIEVRMFAMTRWPLRKAGNLVEHHRGIAHLPHIDVDDAADLLLRLGAVDELQLAGGLDGFDPVPQVLVGHVATLRISSVQVQPP